ncbi:acyl carrier protein [Planomonospora sp. ID67723]|uniref:acyl carrier protein n=1 Tax=Planomonospora sp. ID67723 TaxID=2738134 RepID=UPI001A310BDA|nr:acyl carrier protein [Planomonospora sp. ID67723]MBG0829768.1 acyl carrier protein [Planomonospora sp. ID67723]
MLRRRLAELVSRASDGDLGVEEIMAAPGSLTALGVTSLTYLRLIDAVEEEFGVELDGPAVLDTLDGLTAHIADRQAAPR